MSAGAGFASVRYSAQPVSTLPSARKRLWEGAVPKETVAPLICTPPMTALKYIGRSARIGREDATWVACPPTPGPIPEVGSFTLRVLREVAPSVRARVTTGPA